MAETITMPKLGFDMREGVLVRWLKREGEPIAKGEILAEIETDKATVEVESSAQGLVRRLLVEEGAVVPVGAPIAIIGKEDEPLPAEAAPSPMAGLPAQDVARDASSSTRSAAAVPQAPSTPLPGAVKASPLARRLARDYGLDLSHIPGSGPGGRIVRRDVEAALKQAAAPPIPVREAPAAPAQGPITPEVGSTAPAAAEAVIPSRLRQIIARRMVESKAPVPHFYLTHEYRLDSLMSLRHQVNETLPEEEKLSLNDFIVKAVALALRQFPNLNASYRDGQILRHREINLGIAVAVEGGLLTVVCRQADGKPLRQIAAEIRRMATAARQGKVRPEDIEGSTFSISNLGMYDVEHFIAIINPPEAAILAVGSARQLPVVEEGEIRIGWRLKATLSVDHRVSDGAEAARFLQLLGNYLEQPLRLLLE